MRYSRKRTGSRSPSSTEKYTVRPAGGREQVDDQGRLAVARPGDQRDHPAPAHRLDAPVKARAAENETHVRQAEFRRHGPCSLL